ncbi:hypothetical protein B0A48_00281 [Cryoendolithus antarcticus]|uniref:Uncharacterized protein n=1 Tax=Cryoendolithus antarcticus TaxID=1507870 RepID=A0A1V8TU82_9PEZI|nr:hypothetical protein B0A48_00281 [Cryoendolithus antarcticus]
MAPPSPQRLGSERLSIEEQQRLVNEQIWREQFAALPAIGARARRRATQRPCIEDAIRRAERLFIRQRTVEMRSGVRDSGTAEVFDSDEEGREDACVHLARSITFEGKMMLETESPLGAVIVEEVTSAGDGALAATQECDERRFNTSITGDRTQPNIVHNPISDARNDVTLTIPQPLHRRNAISLNRPAPATIDPQTLALGPDPQDYIEAERQVNLVLDLAAIEAADREFYGPPRQRRLDIESIIGSAERRTVRRRSGARGRTESLMMMI